ncbi:glycosyltransferase [Spirochaetota bacterium]
MNKDFTVLMSVYHKENPLYLDECLKSLFEQTLKPKSIVLVKDGLLNSDLEKVIEAWQKKLPLKVVGYKDNMGLAYALSYGLQFCDTELVARMDTDDIALSGRFEKQLAFMQKNPDCSLLSGFIEEFHDDPKLVLYCKTLPLEHDKIIAYAKKRNPVNHMAVMFKKSAVVASGGYQSVPFFEDYDLWIRMIQNGYLLANLPEVLVKARIGNDMIGRRHGLKYAKHELYFFKRQVASGFLSKTEYLLLVLKRVPIRLLPKSILGFVYKFLRTRQ